MLDKIYEMNKHFQLKAGQPVPTYPIALDAERAKLRAKWMSEELQEFLAASDIYQQADALTDLLYYLMGTYVEMCIKPGPLYEIVHEANMKKLTSPNGIIRDDDGKIQKPFDWKHPDTAIKAAIDHMKNNA